MAQWRRHSVLGMVDTQDNATEEEVKQSLIHLNEQEPSLVWSRIYDVKDYMRKCPACHAPINKCTFCGNTLTMGAIPPKRKADFEVLVKGTYYLIECKSSTAKDGFLTANLKPHQHDSLLKNIQAGGRSLLFIGNRQEGPFLYCLTYGNYMNTVKGSRFVKWTQLDGVATVLGRLPCQGHPYYDLSSTPWFKRVAPCP